MTNEEIVRLAKEAGLAVYGDGETAIFGYTGEITLTETVRKFAALIQRQTAEECCQIASGCINNGPLSSTMEAIHSEITAKEVIKDIRTRFKLDTDSGATR